MTLRKGRGRAQDPCCPPRKKPLTLPGDPCLQVPPPTVVDVRVLTGTPGPLCGSTIPAPVPIADLVIEVEFSEDVSGVTVCSGNCALVCRNIRIFRCTLFGTCPNPETEVEVIPDSIAFNAATRIATLTFTSFGPPPGGNPTQSRIVVGDNPSCPILGTNECAKPVTPFRCDFNVVFGD